MSTTLKSYVPGIVLFALCILLSLCSYKDFGIGWDESTQREIGLVSYNYITKGDPAFDAYENKEYGTGFEMPLVFLEETLGLENPRDIYLMRHLSTHLFFLLGCFFGYILCYRLFRNNVIACIGFLMFVFHPRIFAHSYFNSKDVPFLSMFLISLTLCQVAFDKNKTYWYLLLGIACGYTTSIRVTGVILVCIISFFLLADIGYAAYKKEKIRRQSIRFFAFILSTGIALYIPFPTLWADPLTSFTEVFQKMSHYRWIGTVLFQGEDIHSTALPWNYLPVWFCITTPVLWLLTGFIAILFIITGLVRKPLDFLLNTRNRNFLIYLSCFILPVLAVIVFKSVVYDDWRHVYFIYPAFVLLVLYVVEKALKSKVRIILLSAFLLQFAGVGYFMIKYYPHQQVYFNELVSHRPEFLRHNYEMDYWGCSYRQGMQYILDHDTSGEIKVYTPIHDVLVTNALILEPDAARKRVKLEDEEHANYMITNFRGHPKESSYPVFYEVKVCNSTILKVYRLR